MDAVRKEVAVERVEIKIDIDAVFVPSRYVLYLMNNCSGSAVRNRHLKLGGAEDKQLAAIMRIGVLILHQNFYFFLPVFKRSNLSRKPFL